MKKLRIIKTVDSEEFIFSIDNQLLIELKEVYIHITDEQFVAIGVFSDNYKLDLFTDILPDQYFSDDYFEVEPEEALKIVSDGSIDNTNVYYNNEHLEELAELVVNYKVKENHDEIFSYYRKLKDFLKKIRIFS